jgi:hypothetical protein
MYILIPKLVIMCHLVLNCKTFIVIIYVIVGITYHIFFYIM